MGKEVLVFTTRGYGAAGECCCQGQCWQTRSREGAAYSKLLLRGARMSTQRVGFLSKQMLRGGKVFSLRNLSVARS